MTRPFRAEPSTAGRPPGTWRFIRASRSDGIVSATSEGNRARGIIAAAPVRSAQCGFTLLEMVVVMVIIAAAVLLGAMATTGGTQRMQLQSSSKQIAANLRYTRAQAIASGVPQRFTIDPRGHAWQAPNGRHGKIPAALDVNFTGARQEQPEAGVGAFVYFDDGASTGGRGKLGSGSTAWNVDVAWLTGEVTLKRAERGP
jgi:general secretion pathway protein H